MRKTNPLSISKIREVAEGIRKDFNIPTDTFFPIYEYIKHLASEGKLKYEVKNDDYFEPDTYALYDGDDNIIFIRQSTIDELDKKIYRANFTLAHELFHYLQIKVLKFKVEDSDEDVPAFREPEWQANEFAGQLLIPEEFVNNEYLTLIEKFHVSYECVSARKGYAKNRNSNKKDMVSPLVHKTIRQIEELVNNNKYYDAIDLSKELLVTIGENSVGEHFRNRIELNLYNKLFDKKASENKFNYKKLYELYGTALSLTGKYLEARDIFKKSLEMNPFDEITRIKYVDTFRLTNELDLFFKESNEAIKYVYKPEAFQKFYRNLSEYYFRYENFVEALYMIIFARYVYEDNPEVTTPELYRIFDCLGKKMDPSMDAILNFMQNKGINSPQPMIDELSEIYNYGAKNDLPLALSAAHAIYDLNNDEFLENILEEYHII